MAKKSKIVILILVIILLLAGGFFYYYRKVAGSLEPAFDRPESLIEGAVSEKEIEKVNGKDIVILDDSLDLEIPDNFYINIFAEGLNKPRFMAVDSEGQLWLADIGSGSIIYLPDKDNDGRADEKAQVIEGLNQPNSLAFFNNYLYVAETGRVVRFELAGIGGVNLNSKEEIVSLPHGRGHFTRTIIFGNDGKMYVSIGSSCNACIENDERRASIMQFNPDGSEGKIFANGLRNSVGMTVNPRTEDIWATDNGRDWLGDDLPPEEINIIKEGGFYGWPYCYGDAVPDPGFGDEEICSQSIAPRLKFQAHSAPLGLSFYTGDLFPAEYSNDIFASYHGSWNRSVPTGYKVVRFDYQKGDYIEKDFLTGFLKNGRSFGRPVDVQVGFQGELYISDDKGGRVFRVTYSD